MPNQYKRVRPVFQPVIQPLAFSVAEAAMMVGVSGKVIAKAIKAGEMGHFELGRRILITHGQIEAWIIRLSNQTVLREARRQVGEGATDAEVDEAADKIWLRQARHPTSRRDDDLKGQG